MKVLFESLFVEMCEQYIDAHCKKKEVIIDRTLHGTFQVLETQ